MGFLVLGLRVWGQGLTINTSLTLKSLDPVTVSLPPPGVHDPEPAEDDEGEQASQEHYGG